MKAPKNSDSRTAQQAVDRVLRLEAQGLEDLRAALGDGLGAPVAEAVDLIDGIAGRLVVTGMGKSGHIGRKIAATMASVGTPALYVHPGEASHGDLGMITKGDAVLALSNSGQTEELSDTIAFCLRFGIPLIGMTGRANSSLAEQATVALILPPADEACPMGLAPTTSTTMMLALGDALAVALLERKGFSAEAFHMLHPGGKLGRRLLRVVDLMHQGADMPLVAPDTPMADVLLVMTERRLGCAGIVDTDGRLSGIITDGDLRRHMGAQLMDRSAADIMTRDPRTIRPGALAAEAIGIMNSHKITGLFAVEEGKPVGFLHMHDCLREGVA